MTLSTNPAVTPSAPPRDTDCLIIGAGIAGLCAALELLDLGKSVTLIERMPMSARGGLARESFGGINIVGSPQQRLGRIKDSPEQAFADWCAFAEFEADDHWPRRWAELYTRASRQRIYDWLHRRGVRFFPVVHWVERGYRPRGNSLPRFHMVWGTGKELIAKIVNALDRHPRAAGLTQLYEHRVTELVQDGGRIVGCRALSPNGSVMTFNAPAVILAAGGFASNLDMLRRHWPSDLGPQPEVLLNGAHDSADGALHEEAARCGARLTHMDLHWNYAAGVHHPSPRYRNHGLSLVPPHSALWLDASGERIGPRPLITSFDTRSLVAAVCKSGNGQSWQVLNWKIALKELAVSGAEYNDAIRDKNLFGFLMTILRGNRFLLNDMVQRCPDFVVAPTLAELVTKMNALSGKPLVQLTAVQRAVTAFDQAIDRGPPYDSDEQLRAIAELRRYAGDRSRTCNYQKILDPSAGPLIAIREFVLTRKCLGGVQTDLHARALDTRGTPVPGLYAVGEIAGFGGGGIHGKRSLEGTFLGSCVLTAQCAAHHIASGALPEFTGAGQFQK